MNVILADVPTTRQGKGQYGPNLGVLYLASYVREIIPSIDISYIPERYDIKFRIKMIKELKPKIYGISFSSYAAPIAYKEIRCLKTLFPWIKIICGGPHPTAVPREILEQVPADVCVLGEGEITFADLVKNESEFPDILAHIPGIAYIKGGKYKQNRYRPYIQNIDEIPFPARDLVSDRDFVKLPLYKNNPTTEMVVSRGCPYRCVFCSNPVFRLCKPALRMRSPKSIAEEAEMLYQKGYREIYLHSDELNCDHDWAVEVCEVLAELKHSDLFFQCNMRADKVSLDLVRYLRKMNCWLVRIGIESANQRVLDGIKKNISVEQITKACSLLSENMIKVFGFFMMFQIWEANNQLVYETPEEIKNSLDYASHLCKTNKLNYISWAAATPVQGSEMYDILKQHGFINSNYYPCNQWDISNHLPSISKKQYNILLKRGMRLQAKMAIRSGSIGWKNWRRILLKGKKMLVGK